MINIAFMFLKKNIESYKSIFIAIVLFIFLINVVSIFLLGMNFGLNEQVINNDNLNIMELYPNENQSSLSLSQLSDIKKIDGVLDAYYTEGASIECVPEGKSNLDGESFNFSIFKLDHKYLKYYGMPETINNTYFYGNISKDSEIVIGNKYTALKNDLSSSTDVNFSLTDAITIPDNLSHLIPSDVSFVDPITFDKLAKNCDSFYVDDSQYKSMLQKGATIHLIAPDVTKQNSIADEIRKNYSNMKVSYILDSAVKLPVYVATMIKIGVVLLVVLLLFYFLSIHNNISNIINFRSEGIKLFNVLGVEPNKIVKSFYLEFIILGSISWLIQMILTLAIIYLASMFFDMEMYRSAIVGVVIGNIILIILSMVLEGYISIQKNVKKLLAQHQNL